MANKIVVRDRACKQCGTSPITGTKFCSEECCQRWHYEHRDVELTRARVRAAVRRHAERKHGPKPEYGRRKLIAPHPCGRCGTPTQRPKYCSNECAMAWDVRYVPPPKQGCAECRAEFQPTRVGMSYCSTSCQRKAMWRVSGRIYRARKRGASVERVDPIKVFDRDGWQCHLCGKQTRKDKRGTTHPNAPELDHIVPLAQGGDHSYANTACAHRKCNLAKADKILGQPSLLAA